MGTVRPPIETKPESNVRVMYAPWYWESRISSAVSLNHPLNQTAFDEFTGWVQAAPNQVGVYDYPGGFVFGTAERIKLYARNGVRWIYFNGGDGEMFHWVASQLLWDPDLDTWALIKEFTKAFYGPAAPIMDAYLEVRKETIDRCALHNMVIFDDPAFVEKAHATTQALEDMSLEQPLELQVRILEGAADILYTVLRATRPSRYKLTSEHVEIDPIRFRADLQNYMNIQKRILSICERTASCRKRSTYRKNRIYRQATQLKLMTKKQITAIGWRKDRDIDILFNALLEGAENRIGQYLQVVHEFQPRPRKSRRVYFDKPGQSHLWHFEASDTSIDITPTGDRHSENRTSGTRSSVRILAPLTRFPLVRRGNRNVHAGRISATRRFDPPLEIGKCRFLDLHVHASHAVPATIYIDRGIQIRSDVELFAGEQSVRIDFGSFVDHRFNVPKWEDKIHKITIDFWPQDNLYPYKKTRDTEIVFQGIEVKNSFAPLRLDNALALTHFRSNMSPRKDILRDITEPYSRLMASEETLQPLAQNMMPTRITEKYRTVTVHRVVSPISRIITEAHDTDAKTAAAHVKSLIAASFGKTLPHEITSETQPEGDTNSMFLRRNERIDGFCIEAKQGRVTVEGKSEKHILEGVQRYFDLNSMPASGKSSIHPHPDGSDVMIHEFVSIEGRHQP